MTTADIAKAIDNERRERGLSLGALSRKADVAYKVVQSISRSDVYNMRIGTLVQVAHALDLDFDLIRR